MIINLPEYYYISRGEDFVKVENGKMTIRGVWFWDIIMYKILKIITTDYFPIMECYYCHKKEKNLTIDHQYPVAFGGVSLTSNMVFACKDCNGRKGNMNEEEFKEWRTLKNKNRRDSYYNSKIGQKTKKIKIKGEYGFDLPHQWISFIDVESIKPLRDLQIRTSKKYKKAYEFVEKNQKIPRPLILSSNYYLLDGYIAYSIAQEFELKNIPVIILNNVKVLPK